MTTTLEPQAPPPSPPELPSGPWSNAYMRRARDLFESPGRLAQAGRVAAACALFLVVLRIFFEYSLPELVQGISLGSLYGIIAVGIILIYRTNRIINFAAGAIGAVPAIAAALLDVDHGMSFALVLPLAIAGGALCGWLTDAIVIRRFQRSPRLILTVVSIGIAQSWGALGFFIPVWMGNKAAQIPRVPTPWETFAIHNSSGKNILTGNQVAALVVVVVMAVLLATFLRYSRVGIALRAAAENADRASLLGIPVQRIQTVAWVLAGVLSAVAILVQTPLVGVPNDATLGFDTLLYALAAALVARMERMGVAVLAGMGVGVLVSVSISRTGSGDLSTALMLFVVLGALLVFHRRALSRAEDSGVSTWEMVKSFRPVPAELRQRVEVMAARNGLLVAGLALAIVLPFVVSKPDLPALVTLPIFGIVAVSLVVLTGWAGQISLGQFGLAAVGAAVPSRLLAEHNVDFFVAIGVGIAAGVLVAVIIGLPAVRIQGLYLAVTTLAFSYAMYGFFLNKTHWIGRRILPSSFSATITRPLLYGRIDLEDDRWFYFVCLVFLVASMLAVSAFRKSRSGRVLIAARDNQRAAPAYAVNLVRTRLAAFAVSGGIAGLAGTLLAYAQHNIIRDSFSPLYSITAFLAVVIGGLTSVPFAVIGVITFEAVVLFGPRLYESLGPTFVAVVPLLLTGPLLVLDLYFYPGGTAEAGFQARDRFLRWVARRHDILVPSLVADRRVEADQEAEADVVLSAEHSVVQAEGFADAAVPTITCPSCGEVLSLDDAAGHEHLQGDGGGKQRMARARGRRT